jgi:catechol 2,3-dioxygenase-like lactoylglutathione lyase family enzyme
MNRPPPRRRLYAQSNGSPPPRDRNVAEHLQEPILAMNLLNLRPMLAVTDLRRTIEFYCGQLGFRCRETFGDPPVWCDLERDGAAIMFNMPPDERVRRDVPRASRDYSVFYCNVADVVALHAEFATRGVPVSDLRVTVYGMREFEVRDPDGIWLWFGQPTDDPPTVRGFPAA